MLNLPNYVLVDFFWVNPPRANETAQMDVVHSGHLRFVSDGMDAYLSDCVCVKGLGQCGVLYMTHVSKAVDRF